MLFTVLLVTPHNRISVLQAYRYLEEMQKRIPAANLNYYVPQQTIEAVHRGAGVPLSRTLVPEHIHHSGAENKEVEEEVADEVEDL